MKRIQESSGDVKWDNQLIDDLAFIKKHRRYPFRRMTILPLLGAGFIGIYFFLKIWQYFFLRETQNHNVYVLLSFVLLAIPVFISLKRYIELIRFHTVITPFFISENIKLLERFLEVQHLLVFKHPRAPEIFQIVSKNISAIGDEREVLIFIVDDKRILINSHFFYSRKWFRFFIAPTHHKEMIKLFMKWLKDRHSDSKGIVLG